ncbi:alpha/beta-hydrolase [Hypoxylon sp. FL0890]|nr:alpha/beta-hydrolase [Hypoxylon sp. FL0890]
MKSAVLAALLASLGCYATAQSGTPALSDFDWTTVKPSTSLNYTACYGAYKCAKLSVPLDWLNESTANSSARVSIAITTLPAVVAESDPSFSGTIIINPGGPGGSGVQYVLDSGKLLQGIADGNKHYEILSFDPRGVGFTDPKADCYNDEFSRAVTTIELRAMGPLDSGLDVVNKQTSMYGAYGSLCEAGPEILAYMSTASVARDMVEIVDKIDELRNQNGTSNTQVPRIQYWGLSYGTVLGNFFASMFPGRVGRMILEGVVDIHDWVAGEWAKNLQDTLKVYDIYWSSCFEAGSQCALYKPNDTSADDIRHRVETFLNELDASPAPFTSKNNIEEITKADIIYLILEALYQPLQLFPYGATLLSEAMAGNFSGVYTALHTSGVLPTPSDSCASAPKSYTWSSDTLAAIACGDAASQAGLSTAAFLTYLHEQKATAGDFGAWWARVRLNCKGWRVRPSYRFEGPFTTPKADPSLVSGIQGRPAAPLLFLSSMYDPVTPRANAVAMAREHAGAVVLVQDSAGHGTQSVPGRCRDGYVRRYFETGEVPADGTVCEADCKPFQDCPQAPQAERMKRGLGGGGVPEGLRRRRTPLGLWR